MSQYVEGQRYLRNKNTGAVFQYKERLAGFQGMELLEANAEGELVAVGNRVAPDPQLSPTKTPEKPVPTVTRQPLKTPTGKPIMNPVST